MATYVIGDVQGGYTPLMQLLESVGFDDGADRLWFVGDLVNRGHESLQVLRFVKDLGERAKTVLGNHDLHLLAVAENTERTKPGDTVEDILQAPDHDELMAWLRSRPLIHRDQMLGVTMVHAGLPPQWDVGTAVDLAGEVQAWLRGSQYHRYFEHMYGNKPAQWCDDLDQWDRLRFITNCLTRLRYCDEAGVIALKEKGAPGSQAAGLMPWFQVPGRKSADEKILFGHWSTLGVVNDYNVISLDCGCVWGGSLVAYCIERNTFHQVHCEGALKPGSI